MLEMALDMIGPSNWISSFLQSTGLKMMNEQGKSVDGKNREHVSSLGDMGTLATKDLVVRSDRRLVKDVHGNITGLIFMCNKQTMKECFHHGLFGLPYNMWNLVRQVVPGTILFLFEYEQRRLRGIYEATTDGKLNIEKSPYSTGSFPAQVRFKEVEHCPWLEEDEFRDAIEENYFSPFKFHFSLSYNQVQRLCEAFLRKSAFQSKYNLHGLRTLKVEEYVPADVPSSVPLCNCEGTECMDLAVDYHLGMKKGQGDSCVQGHTSLRRLELSHYQCFDSPFSDKWLQSDAIGFLGNAILNNCSDSCQRKRMMGGFSCLPSKRPFKSVDYLDGGSQCGQLGIYRDELDLADYSSCLHADRLNCKPSVWSRISSRVVNEEDLSENVETNNGDGLEGSCYYDDVGINGTSEYVADRISFKRRKSTEKSEEIHSRRKKINRPDFSEEEQEQPISMERIEIDLNVPACQFDFEVQSNQ